MRPRSSPESSQLQEGIASDLCVEHLLFLYHIWISAFKLQTFLVTSYQTLPPEEGVSSQDAEINFPQSSFLHISLSVAVYVTCGDSNIAWPLHLNILQFNQQRSFYILSIICPKCGWQHAFSLQRTQLQWTYLPLPTLKYLD